MYNFELYNMNIKTSSNSVKRKTMRFVLKINSLILSLLLLSFFALHFFLYAGIIY